MARTVSGPAARRPLVLVAILAIASVIACTPDDPPARLDGLLVLAGDRGGADLEAWFGNVPADAGTAVETPRGSVWISAGRADVLATAVVDGTLRTSDPLDPDSAGSLEWREPRAEGVGDRPEGPFYFPTWDPEGGRLATLAGDLDAEPRLTLIDPTVGSAFEIELGRPVAAAPPAWVGEDAVAVVVASGPNGASVIVDTTTGDLADGPKGGHLLATSADGATIAIASGDGDPVVIRSTAGWLAGDGSSIGSVDPPGGSVAVTAIALDPTATRLAIAWLDEDGSIRVDVHARDAEWRRVAQPDIGDAEGAVVAWMR